MKLSMRASAIIVAVLSITACSSTSRSSLATDLRSATTGVVNAAGNAANNAAEVIARNIATQQGEQQFKSAGQELAGPLTCMAKIHGGVANIDINCAGMTKAGGAAELTGTTNEVPGASVVALSGKFTGTVDGKTVFTTQRLGG